MKNAIDNLTEITTTTIETQDLQQFQNTMKKAVTDCICYSDCQGFSVCNCYGYCNCNY